MENTELNSRIISDLELDRKKSKGSMVKKIIIIILLIIVAFLGLKFFGGRSEAPGTVFKTEKVTKDDLVITVSTTGSLEPRNQVDIGSEMSGIIKTVDVDFNDHVKNGQVLATIDTTKQDAQVQQSKASLQAANAQILEAEATVTEARNELNRMKKVWELSGKKVPSQNELDAAEAKLQRAAAAVASANAQVSQAKATLEANKTDLEKMVIRSPIDGIVLDRDVEPGQTVAASYQTPVLFTIAEDLTKMELSVDVDEADVGMVEKGQDATFTVDAYPDRTFKAKILQVKYGSETTDGVVTYETLLSVDNSDLLLRPGMTATAEIIVKNIKNAILIPNAALRFEPPMMKNAPVPSQDNRALISRLLPGPPSRPGNNNKKPKENNSTAGNKKIWIFDNNHPMPVDITTGATDGSMTQVTGGGLLPDTDIITGTAGQ